MPLRRPRVRREARARPEEAEFVENAKTRAGSDLDEATILRAELSHVAGKVEDQRRQNHWAEAVRRAMGEL